MYYKIVSVVIFMRRIRYKKLKYYTIIIFFPAQHDDANSKQKILSPNKNNLY